MGRTTPVAVLFSAGILVSALWYSISGNDADRPYAGTERAGTAAQITAKRRTWKARIAAIGAERAYAEFKVQYADHDFRAQHNLSHLWGGLLYETVQMDGITVCDPAFGDFGCEHGFTAAAISDRGLSAVEAVNAACREALEINTLIVSCQHGIGHGILEYLGRDRLLDALEACPPPHGGDPFAGCAVGVFMEYNVPSGLAADTPPPAIREFNPANPYAPCLELPEQFRPPCLHQLPQWWDKIFKHDYNKIAMLCTGAPDILLRRACARGMGNVAGPASGYNVSATLEKCRSLLDHADRVLCIQTASQGFASTAGNRHLAPMLCASLDGREREGCAFGGEDIGAERE